MHSKVRIIGALAVALALAAGAAQALPRPTHRPQPAAAPAGLVDAARAWLAAWFQGGGRPTAIQGKEGSFIDPNGIVGSILQPLLPPTCPITSGGTPPTS